MFRYLGSPRGSAKLDRKSLASAAGTNQTPRTNAPSRNVLEPSRSKRRNGSRSIWRLLAPQHVPLSAVKSGFFIPAAVRGTAAAARRGRREAEKGGTRDGGGEGFG
jgi:hypothetical protein